MHIKLSLTAEKKADTEIRVRIIKFFFASFRTLLYALKILTYLIILVSQVTVERYKHVVLKLLLQFNRTR